MAGGLTMAAVGLAVLTQVGGDDGLAIVVGSSLIISLGMAPVFGLTTELIVGSAPPERAGAASGISETGAELGGALGISILGSIGIAIYRGGVAEALPAGIPADVGRRRPRHPRRRPSGVAAELPAALGRDRRPGRQRRVRPGHAGRRHHQCGHRRRRRRPRADHAARRAATGRGAAVADDRTGPRAVARLRPTIQPAPEA